MRLGTGIAMRLKCGPPGIESEHEISLDIMTRARKYPHWNGSSAKRGLFRGQYSGGAAHNLARRWIIESAVPIPRREVGIAKTVEICQR
jgi:hypothetical protein